jgi:hypothetical protein
MSDGVQIQKIGTFPDQYVFGGGGGGDGGDGISSSNN